MKEVVDSSHRKLIRPSLTEVKEQGSPRKRRQDSSHQNHSRQKRVGPSYQTHAEAFYYVKQMQNRTPMVVVLKDGERLRGVIEWYDRACLKLNRDEGPNIVVYKDSVKYLHKATEADDDSPEQAAAELS